MSDTPLVRCSGCGAVLLRRMNKNLCEQSLYCANLRRTRPLDGVDAVLIGGKPVRLREAPLFCSRECLARVTEKPETFVSFLEANEGPWNVYKGWEYRVLWDNRSEVCDWPPRAPSVLTFTRRTP